MLSAYALEKGYSSRIISLAIKDQFIEQGNREDILKFLKLDIKSVYKRIKRELR